MLDTAQKKDLKKILSRNLKRLIAASDIRTLKHSDWTKGYAELGRKANVSSMTIANACDEDNPMIPNFATLHAIAVALGVDYKELWEP